MRDWDMIQDDERAPLMTGWHAQIQHPTNTKDSDALLSSVLDDFGPHCVGMHINSRPGHLGQAATRILSSFG